MAIQQTLAMIKPDAVQRNLIGSIIQLMEANKLAVKKMIMIKSFRRLDLRIKRLSKKEEASSN